MANMRYQPQGLTRLDRRNSLGAKVIECVPFNGQMSAVVSRSLVTLGAGGSKALGPRGYNLRGSGAGGRATVPLDLSKYRSITVAFWLYWDAYANNDALAMEFGATYGATNGFLVDPNCSSPAAFMFGSGDGPNSNLVTFPRPSAGAWHRILLTMDRAGVSGTAYVDGIAQPITAFPGAAPTAGSFASDTLHLFSRNEASLLGTGNMEMLTVYAGVLGAAEAAEDARNPYQIFAAPEDDDYVAVGAPASVTGTLVATLPAPTMSATGQIVNAGAFAATLAAPTMAASGIAATPPSGSFAATMAAPSMSAAGIAANYANFAATMAAPTMSATGTAAPHATGTLAFTMPAPTFSAFGFTGDTAPVDPVRRYRWRILRRNIS